MTAASLLLLGGAIAMAASAEPLAKYEITEDDPQTAALLASGWWDAEQKGAWSGREDVAVLEVPAAPEEGAVLLLSCTTLLPPHYDEGAVSVTVNGEQVRVELAPEWKEYELPLPEGLVKGGEELEVGSRFAASAHASSVPGSEDWRTLSVGFDYLGFGE